ncbi:uncharacterized protein At4g38062 isoform X2 [Rosa chinensis]|uniref:uncharacterized protein At4g38062 isoform X2 n=1 Tax=Rosa chinensis TaxID=74649 RepID=UPI001AD8E1F1|nr:uncharacterized protein At4g38062 isoform X2 [Rosa chinensis]
MENVYKELDNVKAEMERLKAELRVEKGISDTLKKSHSEQLIKFQQAKREVEKQAQELNVKLDEISQLRADCELKLKKLEGENKELAFAFDEVSEKNKQLEQNACASSREIEGLKRRLLTTESKCYEAEQKAQAAKDLRQRDDIIMNLEEENRNAQDQLKWKKEQFKHLEEAHRRLQDQFKLNKDEWERGKSALIEEISLLQTSLDSKTRILTDIQKRLQMCNQALAREESMRKFLEVEISEFKSRYEDVFAQCQQERSKFESLTVQRDEEIAKLRNSIGTRDTSTKEMEFRIAHLEQENQELRESLKELQESQIRNAGATSLTKLRNKIRGLEQAHSNCSRNLKAKESEWSYQIEKMNGVLNGYNSELKGKEKQIQETELELESCQSMIEVLSEEISIILTIFKSEFLEAFSKNSDPKAEVELCGEMDNKISVFTAQLEMKDCDFRKVLLDLEQEHEQVEILMKRVRSLELTEQRQNNKEEELKQHKNMLEELSVHQLYLKGQFLLMEGEKQDISETLEKVNLELAEKICEISRLEDELKSWKSSAESLKICCEENQEKCRQIEDSIPVQTKNEEILKNERESLISIIKEKNNTLEVLQQQIVLLAAKNEEVEACTQDKENLIQNAKDKDSCIENLHKDISQLEQECIRREMEATILARFEAEKCVGRDKERLFKVISEKDQNIQSLEVYAVSLEQDLTTVLTSSFAEVVENLVTIDVLTEALKKAKHMSELQIEHRNKRIVDLEKEVTGSRQRLIHQEEALFHLKQQVEELEALLEAKKLETNKLMVEQRISEGIVKQLEYEKAILLQDTTKLSKERENIFVHLEEFCDRIGELTYEDTRMMDVLEAMLQGFKEEVGPPVGLTVDNLLYDSTQENESTTISASARKIEASAGRLPLKEMNLR